MFKINQIPFTNGTYKYENCNIFWSKVPTLSFFYLTGEKFLKYNTAFVIAPLYENDVCGDIFTT